MLAPRHGRWSPQGERHPKLKVFNICNRDSQTYRIVASCVSIFPNEFLGVKIGWEILSSRETPYAAHIIHCLVYAFVSLLQIQ